MHETNRLAEIYITTQRVVVHQEEMYEKREKKNKLGEKDIEHVV